MSEHIFGGEWTEIKLDVLEKYLSFYTTAFRNQFFTSIYIDAFAGSGERQQKRSAAPLLHEEETIETLAGSAKIALSIDNPYWIECWELQNGEKYFMIIINLVLQAICLIMTM